jgi:hypothetical protein
MDTMGNQVHSRRTANGIGMFRGAVMAGLLASTLLTTLPSVTFADGRDGDRRDDKGRHSLVQHPYAQQAHNARNPFAAMQAQIDALTMKVNQLTLENDKLKGLTDALGTMQTSVAAMQTNVSTLQGSVKTLETKTADSIALSQYIKVEKDIPGMYGPHILITGANVHVRSGSGATDNNAAPFTGLGNLIIGYNENTIPTPILSRNGSHNLVGGSLNSFSSYGAVVFGAGNSSNGAYASVLSGTGNKAVGNKSAVYGGMNQTAQNDNSYAPVQGARPTSGN